MTKIDPQEPPCMIEAVGTTERIRRAYDLWSAIYAKVAGPLEHGPRLRALELAGIQPLDIVLEVAVGTGAILLEVLKRVDKRKIVYGTDLSPKMLHKARQLAHDEGHANLGLYRADARQLPFRGEAFDVIYSSYFLDLLELKDMPPVLDGFKRVLRPGGRLVLVNLSKEYADKISWIERFYLWLPAAWVPYLLGSCRPVFMQELVEAQGFIEVKREFIRGLTHSEIVTARKPSNSRHR